MGKKNRILAAAATARASSSSGDGPLMETLKPKGDSLLMENLKMVNTHLVKESALCRRQIELLRLEVASMAADNEIFHDIERDVFKLVLSSSLGEAAERMAAETATVTDRERDLMRGTESVVAEVDAAEERLHSLIREKDEKEKELAELKGRLPSVEQTKERGREWRRWLFPAAATATCAVASWALFALCKSSKK